MDWTRTPPTVPGIYWLFDEGHPPELVRVASEYGDTDRMNVWGFCWRDYDRLEQYPRALWMGPIEPPPLPSL